MSLGDPELVRAAAGGDAVALGVLLQRHHAGLLGLAVTLVGHDDAPDVVHDAFLVALRHISDLKDPHAAGAWLRSIVRTQCLMRLRAWREHPVADLSERAGPDMGAMPEEELERLALRDWVWAALEQLSEPLRVAAILRYFGVRNSYDEIAAVLGVPVGTVRSRLNQVRLKLADRLLAQASCAHPDMAHRQAERERHFREAFAAVNRGDFSCYSHDWADDILASSGDEPSLRGRKQVVRALHDATPAMGVKIHLERVIASVGVTVLEARFENPADVPEHCPPATTQVFLHPDGQTRNILLAFAARPEQVAQHARR